MELPNSVLLADQPGHGKEIIKKGERGKCVLTDTIYPMAMWKFYPYYRNGKKNISYFIVVKHDAFTHADKPAKFSPIMLSIENQMAIWRSIDNTLPFSEQQILYSEREKQQLLLIQF